MDLIATSRIKSLKPDSLRLVDMMSLDEEMSSSRNLRRAWGQEEILLDYWGCYDQVFGERPKGSISNRDLLQPDEEGTFLLLRAEHVDQILTSLYRHIDDLTIMTREQLTTLEEWKSLSLANHRHMVAYLFKRSEERGTISPKRLEVMTRKLQFVMIVLLGFIMVPLGLLISMKVLLKGSQLAAATLIVGVMPLMLYGAIVWLFRRAYVKSVKHFSDEGLVRNDGRRFAWTDVGRIVERTRLNRVTNFKGLWRIEIQFKDGESAWVLPNKTRNFAEVYAFLKSLPFERTEAA